MGAQVHKTRTEPQRSARVDLLTALLAATFAAGQLIVASTPASAAPEPADAETQAAMGALALAKHHYKNGRYKEAGKLFHQAYAIDPLLGFLFNAARAEQRAFQLDLAASHFRQVLALKNADARTLERAKFHLAEVLELQQRLAAERESARKAPAGGTKAGEGKTVQSAAIAAAPATAPAATAADLSTAAPGAATWKTPAGYAALGVGALGVGAWVILLLSTQGDADDLNAALAEKDTSGKIDGVSSAEYTAQKESLESRQLLGAVALGVGIASIGAGTWMLMTRPNAGSAGLQLRPGIRHLAVAWRF